ncbi:MAG: hypothetical protein PWR17_107 [Candidatus Methanomethylophilaceae archaeon]|nr:hypothetical protein [Candidatus Methanomethylophilaceae archaeon]
MTTYKNERNRKKLLVPVVALVLCAAAMIGLGYAALVSDVTNTANVVAADGLKASLLDGEGNKLTGGDFASDEDVINYSTSETDGIMTYHVESDSGIKLGGAILSVEAVTTAGTPDVTQVNVWYEITWFDENSNVATAPYNMTTALTIGGQTITPGEANGTATPLALTEGEATEFPVVLNGALPFNFNDDVEPNIPTYTITFHVVPA